MRKVVHFEHKYIGSGHADGHRHPKSIGCGASEPPNKAINLDKVTCGRCKNSRSYKAYRAFVLGLIDKKMLNQIGLVVSGKLV